MQEDRALTPASGPKPGEDLNVQQSLEQTLWQLLINESRLHSERTNFFLAATAFLLTGFAVLREASELGMEFVPLAIGIAFSIFHFVNINYGESHRRLWEKLLRTRTASGEAILVERDRLLDSGPWWLRRPAGWITNNVGSWVFPCLFALMWVCLAIMETFSQ